MGLGPTFQKVLLVSILSVIYLTVTLTTEYDWDTVSPTRVEVWGPKKF